VQWFVDERTADYAANLPIDAYQYLAILMLKHSAQEERNRPTMDYSFFD